jgi:heptosyltransferase-1
MNGAPAPALANGGMAALALADEVLIVKPSSLGDIIHALPAVHALHLAKPGLRLRWLVNEEWAPLLEALPWLDAVQRFPRRRFRGVLGPLRAMLWARRHLPSAGGQVLALDFQGLLRSALLARAANPAWVMGLSDSREGARHLHDEVVKVDSGAHALERCLAMVQALGIEAASDSTIFEGLQAPWPAGWPQSDELVVLHPWSRGAGKSLEDGVLQALCDALAPRPVALVGMRAEPWRPKGGHVTDFSGRTSLPQLALVLRQAKWVISVDSGPMHLAAALNPNTVGIHTWSDPRRVGPHREQCWVWKAGCLDHRKALSAAQCATESAFAEADARRLGAWILSR